MHNCRLFFNNYIEKWISYGYRILMPIKIAFCDKHSYISKFSKKIDT